jgi:UTP--glucose-1-phosphate uridylyltransferase
VRSDAFELTDRWTARSVADPIPVVSLDERCYKLLADFERRFEDGPPSLRECRRLEVEGDVSFGGGVTVKGSVRLEGPLQVPEGALLEG